jgi:transposase
MDMSAAYWTAVLDQLPNAAIVFDRFHLTKLMNEKIDDLRRQMVSEATGLMKKTVKGLRYLLLMRRENVDQDKLLYSSELVCGANNGIARGATGQMRSLLAGGKSVVAPG